MAELTPEQVDQDGLNATYNAVAASDTFDNDGKTIIHVKNDDASSNTVTITTTKTVQGLAVADISTAIPAGEDRFFGPFPKDVYNDSNGEVTVSHSNTTSNTMAILKV